MSGRVFFEGTANVVLWTAKMAVEVFQAVVVYRCCGSETF
jgi:hypothetical protein